MDKEVSIKTLKHFPGTDVWLGFHHCLQSGVPTQIICKPLQQDGVGDNTPAFRPDLPHLRYFATSLTGASAYTKYTCL